MRTRRRENAMARTGTVYLKIRVRLNMDIPEESVEEFVSELDYEIRDQHGLVCDTEIVESGTGPDL